MSKVSIPLEAGFSLGRRLYEVGKVLRAREQKIKAADTLVSRVKVHFLGLERQNGIITYKYELRGEYASH